MSVTHSNDRARPVLGASVRAVLTGWYMAARSVNGTQRVRALVLLTQETREFCWNQQVIHRIYDNGESRAVTTGELEQVVRAIAFGWFLCYLQEGNGQEALVLHQIGSRVLHQQIQLQDLAPLLQKHEPPQIATAVPASTETGGTEATTRESGPPTPCPVSYPDRRIATSLAGNHAPGRFRRFLVQASFVSPGALLLGSILALTRNPWLCVGTLGLLVVLALALRRMRRARVQADNERAQQQTKRANC